MWQPETVTAVNRMAWADETDAAIDVQIDRTRAAVVAMLAEAQTKIATADVTNLWHVRDNIRLAAEMATTLDALMLRQHKGL